jgi:hypothetical protein
MQRPNASSSACGTITFEEALRREMEYRKWVERTHPHLLAGICGAPEMHRVRFWSDELCITTTKHYS